MPSLGQRLNRHWRLHATAFAFSSFGLGAVFLGFTWFPLLRLLSWQRATLQRRVRLSLHYAFKLFVGLLHRSGILTYSVQHAERLRLPVPANGRLIIANHPSLIDVVFIGSLLPNIDCIVKKALWHNVFLRWPVVWAGYIPNDEGEALVADCSAVLAAGHSLLVFPEGTRSRPGEPLVFKRGTAQILLAAGCEVQPITITCAPSTLTKAEKWWQIPLRRPHWQITVEDILPAHSLPGPGLAAPVAARVLTRHLHAYYSHKTGAPLN